MTVMFVRGCTDAGKTKRSISPVINEEGIEKKVQNEINILVGNKKTWDEESVRLLLLPQVLEKYTLNAKYLSIRDDQRDLRNQVDYLNLYARRLAYPTRLRYSMERFPVRYLHSMKQAVRDVNGIHSKLINILESKSRVEQLTSIVLQLAAICLKDKNEQLQSFTTAYNRLRGLQYVFLSTEEFGKAIYSLYESLKPDDAFKLWENSPLWKEKSKHKKLSSADEDVIKKMTSIPLDYLVQEIENSQRNLVSENVCKPEHVEYAKACLKLKKLYSSDIHKQYKLILFILYVSPNVEIKELCVKIEKEWPDKEKHERADIYSTEFVELYNLVSIVDKHGPGMQPPPMCEPSQKDYEYYCNHLSVMANDRIKFVATTLVL